MISFEQYFFLYEAFDTVSEFMLNPENAEKNYEELVDEFKKSGGKILGSGSYGIVYHHPNWPYVLKVFSWDDPYLKFVRYAYKNPHPSFPKFYGPPQRVIPQYRRYKDEAKQYLARMEKLEPAPSTVFESLNIRGLLYFYYKDNPREIKDRLEYIKLSSKMKSLPKEIYNLYEGLYLIKKNVTNTPDLHAENIMMRKNGEYVWIDPVWEGPEGLGNPLTASMTSADLNRPTLRGGRLS
jgi:hypothetical protein